MFQLTPEEWKIFTNLHSSDAHNTNIVDSFSNDYNLRSQFVTSRFSDKWGGNRRPPYAFTEIGVAMLSSDSPSHWFYPTKRRRGFLTSLCHYVKELLHEDSSFVPFYIVSF